jgi:transposase InsO family protein
MADDRLEFIRRLMAEAAHRKLGAEHALAAFEDELRAMAERLAGTKGSLLEDASIAQRLAVLTYLPHRLSAAEQETEAAALHAWFEDYHERRRSG